MPEMSAQFGLKLGLGEGSSAGCAGWGVLVEFWEAEIEVRAGAECAVTTLVPTTASSILEPLR
ncbi:hypothetical protein FHU35_15178 [Saccharopolyspora dendranthemae]|uniref:Uncharacterized protein n=1 Tax=Saccharopolyspora dendranthemae TaxID=1181886 RepID=A0A561U1U3_9PSEU|nr:hypothetical protein FHU35_15178 [Saccharopolyspora dendranthemae]